MNLLFSKLVFLFLLSTIMFGQKIRVSQLPKADTVGIGTIWLIVQTDTTKRVSYDTLITYLMERFTYDTNGDDVVDSVETVGVADTSLTLNGLTDTSFVRVDGDTTYGEHFFRATDNDLIGNWYEDSDYLMWKIKQTHGIGLGVQNYSGIDMWYVNNSGNMYVAGHFDLTGDLTNGTFKGVPIDDAYISSATTWDAKQDALTFGIVSTNAVIIDMVGVADNDYAKFTASGLEGRSYTEVKSDLTLSNVENTAISTWWGTSNIVTVGDIIVNRTALISGLVSTDELLVSDNGIIKRMDISVLGTYMGGDIPRYNLLGTTDQVIITGAGKILDANMTLSLPQDINTTSSPTFVNLSLTGNLMQSNSRYYRADFGGAGWAGSGFTLENNILTSGYSYLEIDYLTVRESMAIYELLVRQIRATNGNLLITAGAVADSVSGSYIWFEDPSDNNVCPFAINDLIKAKRFDAVLTQLRSIEATVSAISGRRATVTYNTGTAQKGDEFVRIGNTSNSARQGSILLSADDTNSPYIDIINGIDSFTDWGNASFTKVRLGNLTGITDATFGALSGYGLYTENAYLTGSIKATAGEIGGFTIAGDSLSGGTINGGTITGGTIRTATGTGQRIVMASNKLTFYDAFNNDVELYGSVESIYSSNRLGSATILASPTIEVGDWWDDSFVQIDRSGNNIRILAQDGDGIPVTTVDVGIILADVNLYRSGANVLTTDDAFVVDGSLTINEELIRPETTVTNGTTIDVSGKKSVIYLEYSSPATITNLTNGTLNQEVRLINTGTSTVTIADNTDLRIAGNFAMSVYDNICLQYIQTSASLYRWVQVERNDN